jgi:hypothetical protein
VCIASFVGGTAPSGVEGYFFNNQGGANTGSMIIFNETTGHAVKTCASSTVAAGDFGPTCTRDTTTGDRFFAEFSAKSGIVYTSPIITGPTS